MQTMQQRTLKANVSQYRGVASVSRLRRCTPQRMFERQAAWAAQAASEMTTTLSSTVKNASARFARLFPLWITATAALALQKPSSFQFMQGQFTAGLAILMLSMGITLSVNDFKRVLTRPLPVILSLVLCFAFMPMLALCISKVLQLPPALQYGMFLVGSINGAQASNLCTFIANGDVALSVVMTASSTVVCSLFTPLLCKLVLGTIVPIDALGLAKSTMQVVLLPVLTGVCLNQFAPRISSMIQPVCPVIGVVSTCALVGASMAQVAQDILASGAGLQIACVALHFLGGLAAYSITGMLHLDESTRRTCAIETTMKSSAFGFLLAQLHFADPLVKVPSAVSVVQMALAGALAATYWRGKPVSQT